jgi:hypothetical protein
MTLAEPFARPARGAAIQLLPFRRFPMFRLLLSVLLCTILCNAAFATTTLTYQGRLDQLEVPLSDEVAMRFQLFTAAGGGIAVGPLLTRNVLIDNGLFSVDLDFGDQPYQDGLWLEVEVENETLSPRQRLAAAPLAVRSSTPCCSASSRWRPPTSSCATRSTA